MSLECGTVDLRAFHGPEGEELHKQRRASCNLPSVRAISWLLQYVYKCYSSVKTNGELLQNRRLQTRDIFCQLHHLFLPVLSLKGICHFFAAIP